jgi:hypothetical protein
LVAVAKPKSIISQSVIHFVDRDFFVVSPSHTNHTKTSLSMTRLIQFEFRGLCRIDKCQISPQTSNLTDFWQLVLLDNLYKTGPVTFFLFGQVWKINLLVFCEMKRKSLSSSVDIKLGLLEAGHETHSFASA